MPKRFLAIGSTALFVVLNMTPAFSQSKQSQVIEAGKPGSGIKQIIHTFVEVPNKGTEKMVEVRTEQQAFDGSLLISEFYTDGNKKSQFTQYKKFDFNRTYYRDKGTDVCSEETAYPDSNEQRFFTVSGKWIRRNMTAEGELVYVFETADKSHVDYSQYWKLKDSVKDNDKKKVAPMTEPAEVGVSGYFLQAIWVAPTKQVSFSRWIFFKPNGSLDRVEYWQDDMGTDVLWRTERPGKLSKPVDPSWSATPLRESSEKCPRF